MRKQFKGVMAVVVDEVSLCGDKLLALIESGLAALRTIRCRFLIAKFAKSFLHLSKKCFWFF